ncbi:uncharacterized protein LOC119075810 [Bradysia coprophila]|uniref:uncharacterized protein LOC119075810 n=1 Tax=Bradysia coprophila TaxID=38358 RepID=UPI00187DA51A|nr:uncharacterized protein LOC119075810 [Bradysia coprophila]
MLSCNAVVGLIVAAVVYGTAHSIVVRSHYEETISYRRNPECAPSTLDKGIKCADIGETMTVRGGLYSNYELHYVPLASAYYVARMADALGYQRECPSNTTFLRDLDIQTPWSGTHGAIAIDATCGLNDLIRRKCTFPTDVYPFLCTGISGTPGTYGRRLETLSYNSILQGDNNRWALFVHCWRAKTPQNPESNEIATSFNVFNLDPVFTKADRTKVINELKRRGFNTDPKNLIEFDYDGTPCMCK